MTDAAATGFWKTVGLLLAASSRRSRARRARQRELLNSRSGGKASNWAAFGTLVALGLMIVLHGLAAFAILGAVDAAQDQIVERQGKIIVHGWFLEEVQAAEAAPHATADSDEARPDYFAEAKDIAERSGGDPDVIVRRLMEAVARSGSAALVARSEAEPGLPGLAHAGRAGPVLGSLLLLWWVLMLICQGEGLELDLQRRRHPMWEWLLSHPVGAGAVFLAEMLSPLASNPSYWAAPVFAGILYGAAHGNDPIVGFVAALLIGVPMTVAAACAGKALEIGAMLRLAPRSRGAVVGLISWFGYASMTLTFVGPVLLSRMLPMAAQGIETMEIGPWPVLGLFLGLGADGSFHFLQGMLTCWAASAAVATLAVVFSARSVRRGLAGTFASESLPRRPGRKARFSREPLYRKELLWFLRDRSAIVQVILVPITVAAFQLYNFRFVLEHARDSWNALCGAAILFGTYFLWVLGPKSLLSEGAALWIALTWPRGLEAMLKAKAWLWALVSTGLVLAVLALACWLFPLDAWKVGLVAIGWYLFARSMAEKSVTLVTVVSESGEAAPVPAGRRWAAQLGMLTFAIGVCTQQWHLAIVGIVYSWITAAAMWENLRARLPYLYDPWSERLPDPPTLMHAMIAISLLVECQAVVSGLLFAIGGLKSIGLSLGYAVCAVGVSIGMAQFLANRGVASARIWGWRDADADPEESWIRRYLAADAHPVGWLLLGLGAGVALGVLAQGYIALAQLVPALAETIRASRAQMESVPGLATAYAVIAIGFAPVAEEYLFRGLVYRTLDRHWGGWKAVSAAAAFFAIYHPPLSWLPVAALGAANCVLFKRSGRLAPAVLLHMSYNAVVVLWT